MNEQLELPAVPYKGTSGWSGTSTSRDRALTEDADGTTANRQRRTLNFLATYERGLTWKELSDITGWHHGQSSGVLSVLHKEGLIYRLQTKRNRCAVYVAKENVNGQALSVRKTKTCKHCGGEL